MRFCVFNIDVDADAASKTRCDYGLSGCAYAGTTTSTNVITLFTPRLHTTTYDRRSMR